MQMSQKGRQVLTMASEGLRLRAYDDAQPNVKITNASQIRGTLTNGYGHTGKDVFVGQQINESQAIAWLIADMAWAQDAVRKHVKVALTQNMFDSLCDFAFNVGETKFRNSNSVLKNLNNSNYKGCADGFMDWNKAKNASGVLQVSTGLTVRCEARRNHFLDGLGVNTYYLPDGKAFTPDNSSGLLKLVAVVSTLGSI